MIKVFTHFIYGNCNSYLVINDATRECVLIDTAHYERSINEYIKNNRLKLMYVLVTHGHIDHFSGIKEIINFNRNVKVIMSANAVKNLNNSELNLSISGLFDMMSYKVGISGDDSHIMPITQRMVKFKAIGYTFICMNTPGHTPGSYCFYIKEINALFTGDVLLAGDIGRTDLITGDIKEMYHSLFMVCMYFKKNPSLKIWPGHGEGTTLGDELQSNIILKYVLKKYIRQLKTITDERKAAGR